MNRQSAGRPWGFNAVLDNVAGSFLFGVAPKLPGYREMMLQLRLAGAAPSDSVRAAPSVGECHFAFPPDCFLRSSADGMSVVGDEVTEEDREAMCSTAAREWKDLEDAFASASVARGCVRERQDLEDVFDCGA